MRPISLLFVIGTLVVSASTSFGQPVAAPDFETQVAPILRKYCVACHNEEEANGELRLDVFSELRKGGENGPVVLPAQADASRMIRVIRGELEPKMPPDDEPGPTPAELAVLVDWIEQGATGPAGATAAPTRLVVPEIQPADVPPAITALATARQLPLLAIGRFTSVDLLDGDSVQHSWTGHGGKITRLEFSQDGRLLAAASGVAGLYGEVLFWDLEAGKAVDGIRGHRDVIYGLAMQPDGNLLATASYDGKVMLWDRTTMQTVRTLDAHNDAVYDLAFSPDGTLLASASGDETIKIWHVDSGMRLDTLPQPLAEQYAVAFSPDGKFVVAGGEDNRVRVWRLVSRTKPAINPLVHARYAHEGALVRLLFSPDGKTLVSAAEDRTIKLWDTTGYTEYHLYDKQPDVAAALAVTQDQQQLVVGRMDGSVAGLPLPAPPATRQSATVDEARPAVATVLDSPMSAIDEQEPNNNHQQAQSVELPVIVRGIIGGQGDQAGDEDRFRFQARAGQTLVLEIEAARNKSPLDSYLQILDEQGQLVPRTRLQAVRDSYITFRGVNSSAIDIRVHNWEEMQLTEYLYLNGEITRLFLAPRGPDSGFQLFHINGTRRTYFDTTATSHALHEPCYIVRPLPRGAEPVPNGLPVFPVYFENDDDCFGRWQGDSRLVFTAPQDGQYTVRVSDTRGFAGADYRYQLAVRSPQPDFQLHFEFKQPVVNAGSGKEFRVWVERRDDFEGEVRVDIDHLPAGFFATSPVVIEAGHSEASGTINALPTAAPVSAADQQAIAMTATAMINGKAVTKPINGLEKLQLGAAPRLLVQLAPNAESLHDPMRFQWQTLKPQSIDADSSTEWQILEDHSLLAGGPNPDQDRYRVLFEVPNEPITALRLEALGHASLPAGAPGRAEGNGNFVLSELRVEVSDPAAENGWRPIALKYPQADYEQSGWPIANALDGKPETGWAIAKQEGDKYVVPRQDNNANHEAWFQLAEPLPAQSGRLLRVQLDLQSTNKGHNLGCFRFAVSTQRFTAPPIPELVIRPGQTVTAALQVDRQSFQQRVDFESLKLNLPHGVIVDNVGLNGVLIPEGQTARTVFFTADSWVPESSRLICFRANPDGIQTSWPMWLHVRH